MRRINLRNLQIWLALAWVAAFFGGTWPCTAEIIKYQKDGVWYYTDSPSADVPADRQEIEESRSTDAFSRAASGRPLLASYPARNALEKASAATVAIKTSIGFGSGFFISADGYILTNKHVIRSTSSQTEQVESRFKDIETRFAQAENQLNDEYQRLRNTETRLEKLKQAAEQETSAARKQAYEEDYRENREALQRWRSDYERRRAEFDREKRKFGAGRSDYDYSKTVADLAQSFTVILADQTQLYARLVKVSASHDLALLKLDGYKVPSLGLGEESSLVQGQPVYAIGNPAKLLNSVTSGIFSGFEEGFIQTNAQIYPGNSGGPLVDQQGRVVGVNTFKRLTHKFEGLGFAIPIRTALQEFSSDMN